MSTDGVPAAVEPSQVRKSSQHEKWSGCKSGQVKMWSLKADRLALSSSACAQAKTPQSRWQPAQKVNR